jgi:nicotinamide-nucleotide amidase
MTNSNLRQALRPPSATSIPNANGTAPGLWVERAGCFVALMPGVPEEMRSMWTAHVRPLVVQRLGGTAGARVRLRVARVAESWLADLVREALAPREVQVAYCVQRFGIDILLSPRTPDLAACLATLRDALGPRIYAEGDRQLDEVVLDALRQRGQTLAVAESCTGGMLASILTERAVSSDVFRGGVVAYANDIKASALGVDPALVDTHGAVSEEVVRAMAEGVRTALGVDWGLATTGIAGPGGGTPDKPVGTVWIATAGPDGCDAHLLRLPGDREQNRRWTCVSLIDALRLRLG